jgi:hypothetical protein
MTIGTQVDRDERIRQLHDQAGLHWQPLEKIIDELKALGDHSLDGDNALANTRDWLMQLARRGR